VYKNISRIYRPKLFSEVVGQEPIVTTLKNALKMGRIAPAYLFCGSRGVGKTTLARLLAKALNCQARNSESEPCGSCSSCLEIAAGHALDLLEIDGASHRGIDDIRQINETVGYVPARGPYKIYLIDEVHMLTKEAFNALLKTLEEPPQHAKFFFATTEPHKMLPTITSRCQRFDLRRLPAEAILAKLKLIAKEISQEVSCCIEESALALLAQLADGSLRDGESLLDQMVCTLSEGSGPLNAEAIRKALGLPPQELLQQLDTAYQTGSLSAALELVEQMENSGTDLSGFPEALLQHYRALLACHLVGAPSWILDPATRALYRSSATHYTVSQLLTIVELITRFLQHPPRLSLRSLMVEALLLQILKTRSQLALPVLIERLEQLEQQLKSPEAAAPVKAPMEPAMPPPPAPPITATLPPQPAEAAAPTTGDSKRDRARLESMVQFAAVTFDGVIKHG